MATDARISTSLPAHPKTKKLVRRLGPAGGWSLVCLFLWAASNRSDGDLSGLSDEDIELAADWDGEEGAFVRELIGTRFLDGEAGEYAIHDWAEHNPWAAGATQREHKARWNAAKRHHGVAEADRLVPEYAAIRNAGSNASSTDAADDQQAISMHEAQRSNAPSPSPSPSPSVEKRATRLPQDWVLPDEWAKWARDERPGLDVSATGDSFRDYWIAKPGKDGRKTDWLATWRNWVRNQRQPVAQGRPVLVSAMPQLTVESDAARKTRESLEAEQRRQSQQSGPTPEQLAQLRAIRNAVKAPQ